MKKTFINILFLAAVISVVSCDKQLDTTPTQSLDEKEALKTSKDVEVALVGAYSDLGSADLYGGRIFICPDLLASTTEISWSGTYEQMTQMRNKAILVDNSFVASAWLDGYRTINDVNKVLGALAVVTDDKKDKVEGEAKFIRGAVYFDLVRVFAKAWNDGTPSSNAGVPLVLTATTDISEASQVARNTVAEVYAQAISDLTEAESKLPEDNGFFADKAAAAGMLARIYLQQGDYTKAADAANRSINYALDIDKGLTASYADAFPLGDEGNTTEDIFAIQVTSSSGYNGFQDFYSADGRGDIQINDDHLALYEPNDDRLNIFYNSGGSTYCGKFDYIYGNVHILRMAELYLIRAEANFRMSTAVGAEPVDDINTIRLRAGVDPYDVEDLTLDAILLERKLELCFEGESLHDAKRLQTNIALTSWNAPELVYPIPLRELRVNSKLTQNEGY